MGLFAVNNTLFGGRETPCIYISMYLLLLLENIQKTTD